VALVRVLAADDPDDRPGPSIWLPSGVTDRVVRGPAAGQLADEVRRWRARLAGQFTRVLWDLDGLDVVGIDLPILHVIDAVVLIARAGRTDERMVAHVERACPPGTFRGLVLVT
jgi:hypothetical protein